MIWEFLLKFFFLFRRFLIMKTTFSYFPRMFENPAPAVKTNCKLKVIWKKNIMKYQLYTNASIRVLWCNFLNLYGRYVLRYESFLTYFSFYMYRIEVRVVAIPIDNFSLEAYTPFNFSWTLPLIIFSRFSLFNWQCGWEIC